MQRPRAAGGDGRCLDVTTWLADKSALARLALSPDAERWALNIQRGRVRVTTVTLLEVGFSTRSAADYRATLAESPVALMPVEYLTPKIEARALDVQLALANRGHHRAPSIPDLLIAATAEMSRLTVLHVDKDFELIADITGQPVEILRLNPDHPETIPTQIT